jgi:hypothetical protein
MQKSRLASHTGKFSRWTLDPLLSWIFPKSWNTYDIAVTIQVRTSILRPTVMYIFSPTNGLTVEISVVDEANSRTGDSQRSLRLHQRHHKSKLTIFHNLIDPSSFFRGAVGRGGHSPSAADRYLGVLLRFGLIRGPSVGMRAR